MEANLNQLNSSLGQLTDFMATFKALSESSQAPQANSLFSPMDLKEIPEQALDCKSIISKYPTVTTVFDRVMGIINTTICPTINNLIKTIKDLIDNCNRTTACINSHLEESFMEFSTIKQQLNKNRELQIFHENRKCETWL